jgi:ribosome modulation factor
MTETFNLPPVSGTVLSKRLNAFQQGVWARNISRSILDNPYQQGDLQKAWEGGWKHADRKWQDYKNGRSAKGSKA